MIRVREIFTGANGAPGVQFVELQLVAGGHNMVTGNRFIVYDAAGDQVSLQTFPGVLANNQSQRSVLVGTAAAAAFFGVPMDLTLPAATMSRSGGAICYQDVDGPTANSFRDCVAWGSYSDATPPDPVGTPFNPPGGIPVGKSIERDITGGLNPTVHQADDDTNNSAADFDEAFPTPRNNAGTVTSTAASAFVGAGILRFNSTEGIQNRVDVQPSGPYYRLTDEGGPVGVAAGCERLTVNRVRCLQAPVTSFSAFTGNLNDVFSARTGLDSTIDGEEDADRITTGRRR